MCYSFTGAPLFDTCPFQLRLLRAANKSNLAQNVTVNNKQSTHQSSYVSSGAGPRKKSILCFYWQEQHAVFKAGSGYDKCMDRGTWGREGENVGGGKRAKLKRDWEGVMQRGNKYERKLFLNSSTMVAAEMSDVLLVEGKGTAYIWSASLLLLSVFSTRGREGVSGVIPNNNLPLFERENANSQTFDQYTQTASWHLFKIALYGAVGQSQIDLA